MAGWIMYFVQALLPNLCDKEKLCAAVSLNERLVAAAQGHSCVYQWNEFPLMFKIRAHLSLD